MPSIAVIGTGFGGLAAVIELKKRGYDDIVVLEKGDDVGGVWRENHYPGAACDVPSPFYSYSFAPNPNWPRRFSEQPAILDYMRDVAKEYDVYPLIRFGTEVLGATYGVDSRRWSLELSTGEPLEVDVLVSAVGQLSRPMIPNLPGRDTFAGETFHSATWNHDLNLTGKRVAVIGTGASAIQFVPFVAEDAAHVTVFQRSAPYLLPRLDARFGPRRQKLFAKVPATQLAERGLWYSVVETLSVAWVYSKPLSKLIEKVSKWHMKRQTAAKPGLFEKIWPDYAIGCKRVLFANDYLPALTRPNVDLETTAIREITADSVVTTDGVAHPADVIIWGTGFQATKFLAPMQIQTSAGVTLNDAWSEGAHALYGMTVPGFPNFLIMYGPNTNTGGGSLIYFLEAQATYLADLVDRITATGKAIVAKAEVEKAYDEDLQKALTGSVWSSCDSWYRTDTGRVVTNWPFLGVQYKRRATFHAAHYEEV